MTTTSRAARAEAIDRETGEFGMVLATEGEASDGHILSMRGGEFPESIPLQVNHANHPAETVGRITGFDVRQDAKPVPELGALARIRLSGEGAALDFRKDLVDAIAVGDVDGVSIRWDAIGTPKRRRDLPESHPAHVRADEPDPAKRSGLFFERWRAIEGSIVAIGADSQAKIGRSDALLRRAVAAESDYARSQWEALAGLEHPDVPQAMRLLEAACESARQAGLSAPDLANVFAQQFSSDLELVEMDWSEGTFYVPRRAADELLERTEALEEQLARATPAHEAAPAPEARTDDPPATEEPPVTERIADAQARIDRALKAFDMDAVMAGVDEAVGETLRRLTGARR